LGVTDQRGILGFLSKYLCPKSDKFALKAARDIAEGEQILCPNALVNEVLKEIEKRGEDSWYYDHEVDCAVFYGWEPDIFKFTTLHEKRTLVCSLTREQERCFLKMI